ncbi:MAG: dicarboxylate/amino acid:cation symporter [Synergistaceae bacterium]|nr:dicarboxylate/amino acid:cation symporter [Synergistaceae bacterium]
MWKKFIVNPDAVNETISEILSYIQKTLAAFRMNRKEEIRANLMAEESLTCLTEHADFSGHGAVYVSICRFFGNITIRLRVPGQEFSLSEILHSNLPLENPDELPETSEAIQNILMASFEDRLKYSHKNAFSTITINAYHSPKSTLYLTFAALAAAAILGILLGNFAPESFCKAMNEILLVRVKNMYLNALKSIVTPVVFFSILSCIAQSGSFSELGRIGGRLITLFVIITTIAAFTGVGVSLLLKPGSGVVIPSSEVSVASVKAVSFGDIVMNIVPSNFVQPFLKMDMLQIIFLAFLCGAGLNIMGDSAKHLKDTCASLSRLFMIVIKIVLRAMPFAAFCSILSAVLATDSGLLVSLAGIIGTVLTGLIIFLAISCVYMLLIGRVNPLAMLSKYFPTMLITSTSSTSASIPVNIQACHDLGISPKVYSFSVPLGATVSLDGSALVTVVYVLSIARISGIDLNTAQMLSLIFSVVVLSVSAPGIPGASVVCTSIILPQMGIPIEALGVVMGIDHILNLVKIPVNSFSCVATTLVTASRENLLDRKTFYEKSAALQ